MTTVATNNLQVTDQQFNYLIQQLGELVAIPSVSNPNSPDYKTEHLEKAANFAGSNLIDLGFEVRYVRINNSVPYVIAQRMINKNLPTLTLYAHYDVQPVDREKWEGMDPFVIKERDGRLYGRGSSDDKGAIVAYFAALRVYKEANVPFPVNVKILFEGEEEYGSANMTALLNQEAKNLSAHALIVLDGLNRDSQTGTLTSSTRGIVNIKLKVNALEKPVHSGIGCLAPDPAQGLAQLIVSLKNPREIPGFMDGHQPLNPAEIDLLTKSSQTPESYGKDIGIVPGAVLRGDPQVAIYPRVVDQPSISIVNMTCGLPDGGNSIQDSAKCTVGIRVLPGQNPDKVAEAVMKHLSLEADKNQLPIELNKPEKGGYAWKANLTGPFSQAYLKAFEENFPQNAVMPCGGAIPMLREFQQILPNTEIVVPGVEDNKTSAHSHLESQDIPLLRNMVNTLITFFAKAGKITPCS